MAIVYTHIRKDNNTVFYVGVGSTEERAFDTRSRNRYWKHVVNKYGYDVVITHKDIIIEEALSIEKYLISFYGRKDLGLGGLVNMTDGGEGTINPSKESIEKRMKTCRENGVYEEMCNRMRECSKKKKRHGINSSVRKECYVYDGQGLFIGYYITLTSFSEIIKSDVSNISIRIDTGLPVKKHYVFSKHMGLQLSKDQYKTTDLSARARNNVKKSPVSIMNINTGEIRNFDSIRNLERSINKPRHYVNSRIRRGKMEFDNYKIILP
jgi:hypothetical protein